MNTQELLEAAATHCPEMVEKTASAMFLLDKLSPEHVQDVLTDFDTISGVFTKKAGESFGSLVSSHGKTLAAGAVAGVALGAINAVAGDMYDAARRGLSSGRNFNRILKQNPELLEKYDKKELKKVFDTVHRFGPEFTADPFLMERVLEAGMQSPDNIFGAVQNIIGARKNLVDAKRRQFTPGVYNANAFVRQDEENEKNRVFQAGENLKSQKFQEGQNTRDRVLNAKNQKFQVDERKEQRLSRERSEAAQRDERKSQAIARESERLHRAQAERDRLQSVNITAVQKDKLHQYDQIKQEIDAIKNNVHGEINWPWKPHIPQP